jgi:nitrate/nitrite transporter NarK
MALGNRMTALVACFFVVALTSGNYAFSVYSGALKHSLKLTQDDLDSIATYPYIAGLFTWLPGILNDRCGPRLTTMLGAGGMAMMLALYWAVATRRVDWDPVVSLVAIGFGSTLANGAITGPVFCSIVKNFPMERGAVVGIAKAWVGLCGGILTQLYVGFIGKPDNSKSTLNFVLMMAGAAAFAAVVPSLFVVVHKQKAVKEPAMWARLGFCYVVVLAMAALVTVAALIGDGLPTEDRRGFAIGILCLLLSPILITLPIFGGSSSTSSNGSIQESLLNPSAGEQVRQHC